MSLDNILWFASIIADAAVVGLLLYRHVWKTMPIFCVYCVWSLLSTVGIYPVFHYFHVSDLTAYVTGVLVDSSLILRFLSKWPGPSSAPFALHCRMAHGWLLQDWCLALGALIWPFASIPGFSYLPPEWHFLMRLEQTTSILQILFFLMMAGCSQLLSIGWRDRELQVATGFGFYAIVGLAVAMMHTHPSMGPLYNHLNQAVVASSIITLLYWVFSFAQKEAVRQEFTPQMQDLLLAVAGAARSTRVGLADSVAARTRKSRERRTGQYG